MILEQLEQVLGQRENNYNHPTPSFAGIADFWNAYIQNKFVKKGLPVILEPVDIAQMMVLMKVSRFSQKDNLDNIDCLVDQAGYAVCTEMILRSDFGEDKN
jgi:hypothetical protein